MSTTIRQYNDSYRWLPLHDGYEPDMVIHTLGDLVKDRMRIYRCLDSSDYEQVEMLFKEGKVTAAKDLAVSYFIAHILALKCAWYYNRHVYDEHDQTPQTCERQCLSTFQECARNEVRWTTFKMRTLGLIKSVSGVVFSLIFGDRIQARVSYMVATDDETCPQKPVREIIDDDYTPLHKVVDPSKSNSRYELVEEEDDDGSYPYKPLREVVDASWPEDEDDGIYPDYRMKWTDVIDTLIPKRPYLKGGWVYFNLNEDGVVLLQDAVKKHMLQTCKVRNPINSMYVVV